MSRELSHSHLALPKIAGLSWRPDLEVWADDPDGGRLRTVWLIIEGEKGGCEYADMLPSEARALAALLLAAADTQERRSTP